MDSGASPIDETKGGMTAVHIAAQYGHWEILALFARLGANMRLVADQSTI